MLRIYAQLTVEIIGYYRSIRSHTNVVAMKVFMFAMDLRSSSNNEQIKKNTEEQRQKSISYRKKYFV